MKLLRSVADNNITYVQFKDLEALLVLRIPSPKEVKEVMRRYRDKVEEGTNSSEFVRIDGSNAQLFFKSEYTDWILDLDECYNMTDKEFEIRSYKLKNTITKMERKRQEVVDILAPEEVKKQIHMLKYEYDTIKEVYDIRVGSSKVALPIEIRRNKQKTLRKELNRFDDDIEF